MEENLNKELEEFRRSMERHGLAQGQLDAYSDLHSYISQRLEEIIAEMERITSQDSKDETSEETVRSLEQIYLVKARQRAYSAILNIENEKIVENEKNFTFWDETHADTSENTPKTVNPEKNKLNKTIPNVFFA